MKMPLITLEGLDGAGKSETINAIIKYLQEQGIKHCQTREPGGTPIAEKLRDFIKKPNPHEVMTIETETLLFYASRVQNIYNVIKPSLERGELVICDRFDDSTVAYQAARGMPLEKIMAIRNAVMGDFKPDLTLYLDIDLITSKQRMGYRGDGFDRIEQSADMFFDNARKNYLDIAKREGERFKVIDARQEKQLVIKQSLDTLKEFLINFALKQKNEELKKNKIKDRNRPR